MGSSSTERGEPSLPFVLPSDYKHPRSGLPALSRLLSAEHKDTRLSSYMLLQEPATQQDPLTDVGCYHGNARMTYSPTGQLVRYLTDRRL